MQEKTEKEFFCACLKGADVVLGYFPTLCPPFNKTVSLIRVDELVCMHMVHGRWLAFATSLLDELLLRNHDGCCYLTRIASGGRGNILPRNFVRSVYGVVLKAWQDVLPQVQLYARHEMRSFKAPNPQDFCAVVTKYLEAHRKRCTTHGE